MCVMLEEVKSYAAQKDNQQYHLSSHSKCSQLIKLQQ